MNDRFYLLALLLYTGQAFSFPDCRAPLTRIALHINKFFDYLEEKHETYLEQRTKTQKELDAIRARANSLERIIAENQRLLPHIKAKEVERNEEIPNSLVYNGYSRDTSLGREQITLIKDTPVYEFKRVPWPKSDAGPLDPAVVHPEFELVLHYLDKLGVKVVVDTTLSSSAIAGFDPALGKDYPPHIKMGLDVTWSQFQHELQHALFYFAHNGQSFRDFRARALSDANFIEPLHPLLLRMYGNSNLDKLKKLLRKERDSLVVNETMSWSFEVQSLGLKRWIPGSPEFTRYREATFYKNTFILDKRTQILRKGEQVPDELERSAAKANFQNAILEFAQDRKSWSNFLKEYKRYKNLAVNTLVVGGMTAYLITSGDPSLPEEERTMLVFEDSQGQLYLES